MIDWHQRYLQQSYWTKSLRDYLISTIEITPGMHALEIGCGTGVISIDFQQMTKSEVIGIDIKFKTLLMATRNYPNLPYLTGDAQNLPVSTNSLDIILCHYFLLWIDQPEVALKEAFRVLKPGGQLMIFAEPDYAARIDEPEVLKQLGSLQTEALRRQGACIDMGRKLPALLSSSGFNEIRYGIMGNEMCSAGLPAWWESEWQVLTNDLQDMCSSVELANWKSTDRKAWEDNMRVLWVPTFYAAARKPED